VTFGRALIVGLMITVVASVCYTATWELIYYKLAPNFIDKYTASIVEKARKSGATDSRIAQKTKEMTETKELYKNPLVNVSLTFIEPLPVGLLFTLVAAGVLSRKRPKEAAAAA